MKSLSKISLYFWIVLLLSCLTFVKTFAQTVDLTEQEERLLEDAEIKFENKKYKSALQTYSQLLSLHTDEAYFRYKYAVCLIQLNNNIDKAIKYLKTAKEEKNIAEADYYLGKAFHLKYLFDRAINYYKNFNLSDVKRSKREDFPVERQIKMAENGKKLVRYAYILDVVDKKKLELSDFYYSYNLDKIKGKFLRKHESLKTRYDRRNEKHPIMFVSEGNDKLVFSSYGTWGKSGLDIYFADRKPDGKWGEPYKLPHPVNTDEDDAYAYLHPDGKRLYFSSKGHNSMGGYDLFVSIYNDELKQWREPLNLDFPVNSPLDDILYVNDSLNDYAVFASNRDSEHPNLGVYKIKIKKDPEERKVENMQDINNFSKLDVNVIADNMENRKVESDNNETIKQDDNRDTTLTRPQKDKELIKYLSKKDSVNSNLSQLSELLSDATKSVKNIKPIIKELQNNGKEKQLIHAGKLFEVLNDNKKRLSSDLQEMKNIYEELNLPDDRMPSSTKRSRLKALRNKTGSLIEKYENFDPVEEIKEKNRKLKEGFEIREEKLASIKEELNKNKSDADVVYESKSEEYRKNDSLRKVQEKLQEEYIDLAYQQAADSMSITESEDLLSTVENLNNKIKSDPKNKEVENIADEDIKNITYQSNNSRVKKLSEIHNELKEDITKKHKITPWFNDEDYKRKINDKIDSSRYIAKKHETIGLKKSQTKEQGKKQRRILENINKTREQIKSANNNERKKELYSELNNQISELDKINQDLSDEIDKADLLAENTNSESDENDNQSETKNTDDQNISADETNEIASNENDQKESTEVKYQNEENAAEDDITLRENQFRDTQKEVKKTYKPEEINKESEEVRNIFNQQSTGVTQTKDAENSINTAKEKTFQVHESYYVQLKKSFNTMKNNLEKSDSSRSPEFDKAEQLMKEADDFFSASENQKEAVKKITLLENAGEKAGKANQELNKIYKEKTGKDENIADYSKPDLPAASEFNDFYKDKEDEYIKSIRKQYSDNYESEIDKKQIASTDSLIKKKNQIKEEIESDPGITRKSELQTEEDILEDRKREELSEVFEETDNQMSKKIEENNKILGFLSDNQQLSKEGEEKHKKIKELNEKSGDYRGFSIETISPAVRKSISQKNNETFRKKKEIIERQKEIIKNTSETSEEFPQNWNLTFKYTIEDSDEKSRREYPDKWNSGQNQNLDFINPGSEKQEELSNYEEKLRGQKEKIEKQAQKIKELKNQNLSSGEMEEILVKEKRSLEEQKSEYQKINYEKQNLWFSVLENKLNKSNPFKIEASKIADSLFNKALLVYQQTKNNPDIRQSESLSRLRYSAGLIYDANNALSIAMQYDSAKNNNDFEKLLKYYGREAERIKETESELIAENKERENQRDNKESEEKKDDREEESDGIEEKSDQSETTEKSENISTTEDRYDIYYRIQFVALKEPLDGNSFRRMTPVVDEKIEGRNIYRYMCGKFYKRESYLNALPKVRALGFRDAFPVAYLDGERINLALAADYREYEKDLPSEFSIEGDRVVAEADETTITEEYNPPEVQANKISDIEGTFFTVQIGVYSKPLESKNLKGISTDYYDRTGNGYYRYFHGRFTSYEEANNAKSQINNSIPDAFVTAFNNGEKTGRDNAAQLLDQNTTNNRTSSDSEAKPIFRIQLSAYNNRPGQTILQRFENQFSEYEVFVTSENNLYYIQMGSFNSYTQARAVLRRKVMSNIEDAFITAYQNNSKISVREALLILKK